jgi:hypothetical protein
MAAPQTHVGPLLRVSKLVRDATLLIVNVLADPDEDGAGRKCAAATKIPESTSRMCRSCWRRRSSAFR